MSIFVDTLLIGTLIISGIAILVVIYTFLNKM
jgi:hypothetical protein